nr:glycosyltransferase family A protein [uncultured Cetobacterium sp.]
MITVFTPTYNREETLRRLYKSLKNQTSKNFEWVVVDDGSSDNTEEFILDKIKEGIISITYKKIKNGGKMKAINKGVPLAKGEYFFIVDSDDYLDEKAIELIEKEIITLPSDYAGMVFRKIKIGNRDVNELGFGQDQLDATPIDVFYNKKILGDKAEIVKTSIMGEFPFPEIKDEKFFPEGYIWNRIGEEYLFRYVDKGIYYYEYLEDGYTKSFKQVLKKNPKGFKIYYLYMIGRKIPIKNRIKFLIRFLQVSYYELIKKIGR